MLSQTVTLVALASLAVAGGRTAGPSGPRPGSPSGLPPAHTVIVVLENHAYGEIIGSPQAPFLNALAHQGALFTASYAQTHPSQPNYLALFSGSTQGVTGDSCPQRFSAPNLASELIAAGLSFAGYAEGLPATGSPVCAAGRYARRHVPWADFSNVPASASRPFSRFPRGHYTRLPTVSFVIPDVCHDMHSCPVSSGDHWLQADLGGYARWAMTHDSLLIVTFDENDGSAGNRIPTIFAGQVVRPGPYPMRISHYRVLRTIELLYGLAPIGHAATTRTITGIWN